MTGGRQWCSLQHRRPAPPYAAAREQQRPQQQGHGRPLRNAPVTTIRQPPREPSATQALCRASPPRRQARLSQRRWRRLWPRLSQRRPPWRRYLLRQPHLQSSAPIPRAPPPSHRRCRRPSQRRHPHAHTRRTSRPAEVAAAPHARRRRRREAHTRPAGQQHGLAPPPRAAAALAALRLPSMRRCPIPQDTLARGPRTPAARPTGRSSNAL